jgi:hypothetical protein
MRGRALFGVQVTDMDDLLVEHQHMLDTVTRECLLTDLTLAMAVDQFLRDTHEFCARTAVACADASTAACASADDETAVYTRCVQQLNTMMTSMMRLPTSTAPSGYRTLSAPLPLRRSDDAGTKQSAPALRPTTTAHGAAHEQFISSIAKELIESLVAHTRRTL